MRRTDKYPEQERNERTNKQNSAKREKQTRTDWGNERTVRQTADQTERGRIQTEKRYRQKETKLETDQVQTEKVVGRKQTNRRNAYSNAPSEKKNIFFRFSL